MQIGILGDADLQRLCGSDLEHDPLPHPITHIRLLEILPQTSTKDVDVRCRLRAVRLADYDQCYTALSYTWDHDSPGQSIFINGRKVTVRNNIYNFLVIYRHHLKLQTLPTVFLWIDAICLDHGNVRERNDQVQIVPNIFAKAKTVLALLEPSPGNAGHFATDTNLQNFVDFLVQIRKDLNRLQTPENDQSLMKKYYPSPASVSTPFSNAWMVTQQICYHDYWSRLWILLENRFAQNLMFMHGHILWTWDDFRAPFVLTWYLTKRDLIRPSVSSDFDPTKILQSPAAEVIQARLAFKDPASLALCIREEEAELRYTDVATAKFHLIAEREPLDELLQRHRRRICSDRRDRVYALLGMSDSALTVDYERSNIELFCAVLLSLKASSELTFVSMLAHHLDISAFQYKKNRRSILKDVPSTMEDQSTADIVGRSCHTVFSVKAIPVRTEISDVMQARLGIRKLKYYQITAQQNMSRMHDWDDFPQPGEDLARVHGYTPGTSMPIVDGFDLSDTSFRAAMFLNPSSNKARKPAFGMISTDSVQDGDILVADERMHSGILIRVSGLSRTWLTVVGVVLFAKMVKVESDFSYPLVTSSPRSTIRSATLSDFCEHTRPTPFTITGYDEREHFTLRPDDIQLQSLFSGSSISSGRHSRQSSNTTNTGRSTVTSIFKVNERRFTSRSDRIERIMDVITAHKRRHSK